jgi:hypothetical protein
MNTPFLPAEGPARVKAFFKTYAAVAIAAGINSWQSVQQWKVVPADVVLALCKASNWELTPHMLRSDLYPNPSDAMPSLNSVAA